MYHMLYKNVLNSFITIVHVIDDDDDDDDTTIYKAS